MDLAAPFKKEVLRPFTTLVVPGAIATGPFTLVLGDKVPAVAKFWLEHPYPFIALLVISLLAAGFIIDDVGANIEAYVWDRILLRRDPEHNNNWQRYLKLQIKDELVAQRYLDDKVIQFKFELAMATALVVFWLGLGWLQALHRMWSNSGFALVTLLVFAGATYLLWESLQSAKLLSRTRALILKAIEDGPQGFPVTPATKC